MKVNGFALIAGAVVFLALLVFVLYKLTLAPSGPDPAKAAPEHKDMSEFYRNQGRVGAGRQGGAPPSR